LLKELEDMTDAKRDKTGPDQGEQPEASSSTPGKAGLASGLQPGGTAPGGGPGAGEGSIGTGGASSGDRPSGNVKSDGH